MQIIEAKTVPDYISWYILLIWLLIFDCIGIVLPLYHSVQEVNGWFLHQRMVLLAFGMLTCVSSYEDSAIRRVIWYLLMHAWWNCQDLHSRVLFWSNYLSFLITSRSEFIWIRCGIWWSISPCLSRLYNKLAGDLTINALCGEEQEKPASPSCPITGQVSSAKRCNRENTDHFTCLLSSGRSLYQPRIPNLPTDEEANSWAWGWPSQSHVPVAIYSRSYLGREMYFLNLQREGTPEALEMKVVAAVENRLRTSTVTKHMITINKHLQTRLLDMIQRRLCDNSELARASTKKSKTKVLAAASDS